MSLLNAPEVTAFEAGTVDPAAFGHRQHLYVAWCYLKVLPLEEALARYVCFLRVLTGKLGVPKKFHATMTWAWVVLLHEAMQEVDTLDFDVLMVRNPGLIDHKRGLIYEIYSKEELDSEVARQRFVFPRRQR